MPPTRHPLRTEGEYFAVVSDRRKDWVIGSERSLDNVFSTREDAEEKLFELSKFSRAFRVARVRVTVTEIPED